MFENKGGHFGNFSQHTSSLKKHRSFLYNLQGKIQDQEGVGKCSPEALAFRVLKLQT